MPHSSGNLPEKPTPRATSSAVAPLRSVQSVVLGETLFKAWYPSFYPEELAGPETERLYICQWCFKYAKDVGLYLAHTVCLTSLFSLLRWELGDGGTIH